MAFLSQYLHRFPLGTPVSNDSPKKIRLIGLIGDFILPIGVNVSLCGCFSLCQSCHELAVFLVFAHCQLG